MGEAKPPPGDSATSKADAMALLEEAEADAAEAEALAAAARARARAARLRREVRARAEAEAAEVAEVEAADTDPDADDVDESDSETDAETVEAAAPKSRLARWRRRLPLLSATSKVAAIILICAFVGATGYMLWYERHATERQQRAANFVAGAKQGVVNMTSLDFNRAKEDVQRLLDSSTGEFRDDFQQRAKDFVSVVEESKVVTQGTINATAVESMGEHSASILVAATSRITNAAGAKDEARVWRLRVTVTEEGGQYKMSKLEFVP
ncbi:MAG: Mce-associated rane protein [Mycobacterium sp.]|nr:Mce-associated rane protein [Mycobacterium sp.]